MAEGDGVGEEVIGESGVSLEFDICSVAAVFAGIHIAARMDSFETVEIGGDIAAGVRVICFKRGGVEERFVHDVDDTDV